MLAPIPNVCPKEEYLQHILGAIEIQHKILLKSNNVDQVTKDAFRKAAGNWVDILEERDSSLTQLKSIASVILTYWRETIGVDTELFWEELNAQKLNFERRDELSFALKKGWFRRVDVGIGARKDWHIIRQFDTVRERFSEEELQRIDALIEADERNRLSILKRCLMKREIPQSKYLKFGECMAYFGQCNLFEKYFSEADVQDLYFIWRNFVSK